MYRIQGYRRLTPWLVRIGTPAFRRWVVSVFPDKHVRRAQKVTDILWRNATKIFELKKAALERGDATILEGIDEGKDIISILRESLFRDSSGRRPDILRHQLSKT